MRAAKFLDDFTWPSHPARFSGFSAAAGVANDHPQLAYGGHVSLSEDSALVDADTRFDLASITKLLTATVAAILAATDRIDLSAPIGSWMEPGQDLASLTSIELLTHTSGLPDAWPEMPTRLQTIDSLLSLTPDPAQRGQILYACTGYSLFALGLEQKLGIGFDQIVSELILDPLGLSRTGFRPVIGSDKLAVSCGPDEDIAAGTVHDPRARHLGGVSGNAGLFSTAENLFRFLSEVVSGKAGVVNDRAREMLFTPVASDQWDQAIGFRHNDQARLGRNRHFFSHTGFTGTLAMVNPKTEEIAVMLSNRLVCDTTREEMAEIYRGFSEAVAK